MFPESRALSRPASGTNAPASRPAGREPTPGRTSAAMRALRGCEARMPKRSAGILLYRRTADGVEVFLVHPGGPFWAKKDDGAWSIPKGEYDAGDDPLSAALREFEEETGTRAQGEFLPLGEVRQPGGKAVTAWAVERGMDAA